MNWKPIETAPKDRSDILEYRELLGTFEITERNKRLHDLATHYHIECEAYDRTICTGYIREGSIIPKTYREMAIINRNAMSVRKRIYAEAERDGFSQDEIKLEISRWHDDVTNLYFLNNLA